jgi:4-alpha-glucanotransferase
LAAVIADADLADEMACLEQQPLIDWPAHARVKLALLYRLFERLRAHGAAAPEFAGFEAFCESGGQPLEDHARFEALHAWRIQQQPDGDHWRNWPAALRDPRSDAVAAFAAQHRETVDFHLFLQWQAHRGYAEAQHAARAAGMAIGLVADIAVGCDSAGSQAWADRDGMLDGISVGAPPDLFNQDGQSWGLTTFSPRALVKQGYAPFIAMLRANFQHVGGARIDHILGLRRLWLVPDGAPASAGAYLQNHQEDMLRLIALESWRQRTVIVGEDLGTVPTGFREQLADTGLLGIRVLWFERHDGPAAPFHGPETWSRAALATTATHDLPTLAGWWRGTDIDWRRRIDADTHTVDGAATRAAAAHRERAADREQLWRVLCEAGFAADAAAVPAPDMPPLEAMLAFVAATASPFASFPLEDLLGLSEQPNLPGPTDAHHPNWRRRLPFTVAELFSRAAMAHRLEPIQTRRPQGGPT